MKPRRTKLTVVPKSDKPKTIDRGPHVPKVSPFAENRDPFGGPCKSLALRVIEFGILSAMVPRRGSN